ncbi:MAG: RT0821/Lpp0805 family surface protein [Alphaproteobacteria bacterium]|nr:RT0821/Lpp0805 family surface protein [Alphaproteobacteria bacterium]
MRTAFPFFFTGLFAVATLQPLLWGRASVASPASALPSIRTMVLSEAQKEQNEKSLLLDAWAQEDFRALLNETDRWRNNVAERRATLAPFGQQVTWKNPLTGHSGSIIPVKDSYMDDGCFCREFLQTVSTKNKKKQGRSTVCQQTDGSWKARL